MSDDLIARLQARCSYGDARMWMKHDPLSAEAAAELSRLRAEVERLTAALSDERAHADALAEVVEMFATDRNWLQGGPFDPCSPSFTGTSMASAVAKQHRARRQG